MLRRLYSTFADGWPGLGLVLMRLVVGSVLLLHVGPQLWSTPPLAATFTSLSLAGSGLLLVSGLWTPLAGTVVALIEISQVLTIEATHWSACWRNHCWGSGDVGTRSLVGRRPALRMEAHRRTASHLARKGTRQQPEPVVALTIYERVNAPERSLLARSKNARIADESEVIAMLVVDERAADRPDRQGADFDGSLELLRELAVTTDRRRRVAAAVRDREQDAAARCLAHGVLRSAGATGRERVHRRRAGHDGVRAGRGDHRRSADRNTRRIRGRAPRGGRWSAPGTAPLSACRPARRSPWCCVAFWSKRPLAFNRAHMPLARRIAYHLGLGASRASSDKSIHQIDKGRAHAASTRACSAASTVWGGRDLRVVGESVEWREVLRKATQVAPTDTTVLITGESGTGKEVVARFIHAASARKDGPFVALNCAALPEQLLESELFGYERGAFTSAHQAKPGQVELASGGVLFLDEVGEMSLSAQAKFLRVLQEREFQRLGGTRLLKANIRVIAATNRDLRKAVERGDFREDLFYRLERVRHPDSAVARPPADIVPLSETFLQEIGRSFGRPPAGLAREARQALLQHDWPGNVRELRNVLERAAILCEGALIDTNHLALQSGNRSLRSDTTDLGVARTHHDREGLAGMPRKQDEGRAAAWVVTHAAPPADSKVPTRGSGQRVIADAVPACMEVTSCDGRSE